MKRAELVPAAGFAGNLSRHANPRVPPSNNSCDQRGNGRSAAQTRPILHTDQIDDLEALRAHLGFEKIDLLGSSWGGYLGVAFAARHPEHLTHLVLVDSAAPKWSDTIFLFDKVFPEVTEHQAAAAFAREFGDKPAEDATAISRASI